MAESSSPDLIQLPRLSGQEAATLIEEMLALARTAPASLPGPIERSAQRLQAAQTTLDVALHGPVAASIAAFSARTPVSTRNLANPRVSANIRSVVRRRAERDVDAAWEATFNWLSGWCKLGDDENPHRGAARDLCNLIFAGALEFGSLPYKIELAQSREHLQAIAGAGHDATFAALGGTAFLTHLRRVHEGLENIVSQDAIVDCRAQLAAAAAALRQYVIRVSSHADSDIEGSEALSDALMAPLARWRKDNPARPPQDDYGIAEETVY